MSCHVITTDHVMSCHYYRPIITTEELQAEIRRRRMNKAREVQMLLNSLVNNPKVSERPKSIDSFFLFSSLGLGHSNSC